MGKINKISAYFSYQLDFFVGFSHEISIWKEVFIHNFEQHSKAKKGQYLESNIETVIDIEIKALYHVKNKLLIIL